MSFKGKSAIVCGAGGGIGLNIAIDLLDREVNVSMVDLKPQPDSLNELGSAVMNLQTCSHPHYIGYLLYDAWILKVFVLGMVRTSGR